MKSFYTQAVNEYYVDLFRKNFEQHASRLEALKSREDALLYQQEVREKLRKCFDLPERKTLPAVTECGIIRHEGFYIRKILCEIRPGDFVPANVYIPEKIEGKVPGVLYLCGHAENGKASATYRLSCMTLALNGCVVLTFDPSGQGEKALYGTGESADMKNRCTWQHNMIARQFDLVGESYSSWCLFDAIRMLDVLCAMPEVDEKRIGVTGNSGGGNMSSFLAAVDERPAAVAPSCYLTSWRHNVENELPCCAEQEPPGVPGAGLEMPDLMIAYAPRPHLILGQQNDFFDPRGTRETFETVKKFYTLLGKEENVETFLGAYGHGYHDTNRDAMYKFFTRHLGLNWVYPEPAEAPADTEEELFCTQSGNVHDLPGARHPKDFMAEKAAVLAEKRKNISFEERKAALAEILDIKKVEVPYFRVLRLYKQAHEVFFARWGLETEKDRIMSILYRPFDALTCYHAGSMADTVELFIPHRDAMAELAALPAGDVERFALDMRGIGAMTPGSCDTYCWWGNPEQHESQPAMLNETDHIGRSAFGYYGYDYHFWACGNMLNTSYASGRVRDIMCAMKLLVSCGVKEIKLLARGQGVYPAALAALYFTDCKVRVNFRDEPCSYADVMTKEVVPMPHSTLIKGILKYTDLDEIKTHLNF